VLEPVLSICRRNEGSESGPERGRDGGLAVHEGPRGRGPSPCNTGEFRKTCTVKWPLVKLGNLRAPSSCAPPFRRLSLSGFNGIIQGMRAVKSRPEITVRKLVLSDSEVRFDLPVPGTMAERIGMVWPLTAEIVSIGGRLDAERRLQRHVAVLARGRR